MFVDKVNISLQAGKGGNGLVSFRHEKYIDKGGPDGGDGGKGASIIFEASRNENTLAEFRYQKLVKADDGGNGGSSNKHGRSGKDLIVKVPVGTVVMSPKGEVVADLYADGQREVIAKGGSGGFGNAHFISSTRQTPRVAEKGEPGEEVEAVLELKMIADVGLVGLPNAGKSTFLSVVSNAKPEIADYPFTTLTPNLGVVDIEDGRSILMADIPGLIEGASQGKGLGDEFLRHVERTKLLLHLVDAYGQDIKKDYQTIQSELASYKVDLSTKPQIVALTKTEGLDKNNLKELIEQIKSVAPKNTKIMAISAQSHEGVRELLFEVSKQLAVFVEKENQIAEEENTGIPVITLQPTENDFTVERVKDHYLLKGIKIERFARRTDFMDFHGEQRFRDIMRKNGITRSLKAAGAMAGDLIIVGDPEVTSFKF